MAVTKSVCRRSHPQRAATILKQCVRDIFALLPAAALSGDDSASAGTGGEMKDRRQDIEQRINGTWLSPHPRRSAVRRAVAALGRRLLSVTGHRALTSSGPTDETATMVSRPRSAGS